MLQMETCVLIPPELSLVLAAGNGVKRADGETGQSDVSVGVWSSQRIPRGTRFLPFQGTVRLDKIDVTKYLDEKDIRHRFGCYDEIQEKNKRRIRHCNWVRFLRYSPEFSAEVNLLGSLVKGEPIYETIRTVAPTTELVVFYEDPDDEVSAAMALTVSRNLTLAQYRHSMGMLLEDAPLDLSRSLIASPPSPLPHNLPRALMTPPSEPEERRSVSSEGTSPSEDMIVTEAPRPLIVKKGRERTLLPCEVCGKAFDRPSLLRRHMRTHTGEKPHVCEVCGKGFSTSSSLNTHRRIHSGEKPHQCHVCGKRFTASSNLYYHRMTHSKEKPHKCTLCSKSFPTPGDLKSHMYVHSGSWPFKCHICNRGFSKQTNLKNHLFLHTGDKPHICEYCQKRFALACNLRAHLKTHEGELQEKCVRCGKSYSTASRMLSHGYCQTCYSSSNGIALTKKPAFEFEPKSPGDSSDSKSSKAESSSGTVGTIPTPPPPLLFGVLDHVMLRYHRQTGGAFLPPPLSAVKFLEGAQMLTH